MTADQAGSLERNLRVITKRLPELARRLRMPRRTAHIETDADGQSWYRVHRSRYPLNLDAAQLEAALPSTRPDRIVIFGCGLGELVEACLERWRGTKVICWDRDPSMLCAMLAHKCWRSALVEGRLELLLGADLLAGHEALSDSSTWIVHPFLKQIYWRELDFFRGAERKRRALICAGTLFVDDVSHCLQPDWKLWTWDLTGVSQPELEHTLVTLKPELVVAINYTHGLPEVCAAHDVPLLVWEIDPSIDRMRACASGADKTWIYTWRKTHVAEFRKVGFAQTHYLPLASNPELRRPMSLEPAQQERYGSPVCFVGSSLISQVDKFKKMVLNDLARYLRKRGQSTARARRLLDEVLTVQRRDPTRYRVPELLEACCPGLDDFCRYTEVPHSPAALVGEIAAAEHRLSVVASLAPHGVAVWGDKGWSILSGHGVQYRGLAGHARELSLIYNASLIHLDIGRIYQPDIITMRVFDVLACGGFIIAEHNPALVELLEPGKEVETWRTVAELKQKVAHYLAHPDEARAIAQRGMERVRLEHTVSSRVSHMIREVFPEPVDPIERH